MVLIDISIGRFFPFQISFGILVRCPRTRGRSTTWACARAPARGPVGYKHRNLKRAYWALLAGFVPLLVAAVYYLRLLDGPG